MAERLQAVMQEKFQPDVLKFDAETPVDKALAFLQSYIKVGRVCLSVCQNLQSLSLCLCEAHLNHSIKLVVAGLKCSAMKLLCPPHWVQAIHSPELVLWCVVLACCIH